MKRLLELVDSTEFPLLTLPEEIKLEILTNLSRLHGWKSLCLVRVLCKQIDETVRRKFFDTKEQILFSQYQCLEQNLRHFLNLKHIRIRFPVTQLPSDIFKGLTNLQTLAYEAEDLVITPFLDKLPRRLEILKILKPKLTDYPALEIFSNLTRLVTLNDKGDCPFEKLGVYDSPEDLSNSCISAAFKSGTVYLSNYFSGDILQKKHIHTAYLYFAPYCPLFFPLSLSHIKNLSFTGSVVCGSRLRELTNLNTLYIRESGLESDPITVDVLTSLTNLTDLCIHSQSTIPETDWYTTLKKLQFPVFDKERFDNKLNTY